MLFRSREEFLSKQSPFLLFYSGITGALEDDKNYVLCVSLPFCKGNMNDKKSVLWRSLETINKNYINYAELIGTIKMIIVMTIRVIPEMVCHDESQIVDKNLQALLDSNEIDINEYADRYSPRPPRNGNMFHKHEFDEWFNEDKMENIFSSKHHRRSFITYLNEKKAAS